MSTPVCETIMVAIAARLAAMVDAPAVRRNPDSPAYAANSIDVYDGAQSEPEGDTAASRYALDVELELFAADGSALNQLYARTVATLCGDPSWWPAGIADLREGGRSAIDIGEVDGHPAVAGYVLTLHLDYWTRNGDPYEPGP